jgi:NTP pyrophosphatase (non-canonical NTP hydrolase)
MKLKRKPTYTTAEVWYPGEEVEGVYTEELPDMSIEMQMQIRNGLGHGFSTIPCAAVKSKNGYQLVVGGDYILPEPDGSGYYPVKKEIIEKVYEIIPDDEEEIKNPLLVLAELQQEVGYVPGELNLVALFGIFGEAGEVLDELSISFSKKRSVVDDMFIHSIMEAKKVAMQMDMWKKDIRDKKYCPTIELHVDEEKFDKELADLLYYCVALAVIRQKPLDYYFAMSVRKVTEKHRVKDVSHANVLGNMIK